MCLSTYTYKCACPPYTQWLSHNHSALFPAQLAFATCDAILALRLWRHQGAAFISVQSLSRVWLCATLWTAAHQASLSITISRSLLKIISIESMMASNHLILCRPLLLLPSIFPNIRVFFEESALCIRWLKYWSFSFSPSNEYSGLISFRTEHIQGCKPGEKNVTV